MMRKKIKKSPKCAGGDRLRNVPDIAPRRPLRQPAAVAVPARLYLLGLGWFAFDGRQWQHVDASDAVDRFFENCVVREVGSRIQAAVLLGVFNAWARKLGVNEMTLKSFAIALQRRGIGQVKSSVMWWDGVRLALPDAAGSS